MTHIGSLTILSFDEAGSNLKPNYSHKKGRGALSERDTESLDSVPHFTKVSSFVSSNLREIGAYP
jgi:hypothetical protein